MPAEHTGIASVPSREGGVGIILDRADGGNLCLKVFYRRNRDFWAHVRSVQEWTGRMRFIAGCTKLPAALRFWIHRDDAWTRTPFNQMRLSKVIWSAQAFAKAKDEALKAVSPDQYILCSEEQLASIYQDDINKKRCDVRLLATYPVQKRECSVKDIIDRGDEFTGEEILRAFYQILCSIEYIYRSGCAHSDIKPGNILVNTDANGKRNFFLNDYDSFYTQEAPSTSATPGFFPKDCMGKLKEKFPESYRILYDCYALAVTILCMAEMKNSPDSIFILSALRSDKLPEQVKRLYQITSFDPENIADIIKELEEKCGCERQSCDYCGADITSYEFDRKQSYRIGEFGYFHEQILLSKFRDPLWMIPNCYINVPQELSDILLMPLGHYGLNTYLHAPDDVRSGKRPLNFACYTPKTLSNTSLSSAEKEILLSSGRKLNEYFDAAERRNAYLPHIIWCDGTLKILWGLGSELDTPINYEDYFRWLVGEDIEFSYQDWRTLLPHECSLSWNASPEYWQSVLDEVVEEYSEFKNFGKDYKWLYKISEFKEFVTRQSNSLSLDGWLCLLPHISELANKLNDDVCKQLLSKAVASDYKWLCKISEFNDFVISKAKDLTIKEWLYFLQHIPALEEKLTVEITDADMIWQIYQRSTATQKKELLQNPQWACVIQDKTANDPKEHFRNFFRGQRYDRETFLKFYPKESHSDLTGRMWGKIIAVNPKELIDLLPERIFSFLNRKAWVQILRDRPDLAERCEKWESFSESEWVSILVKQPDLKKFVPDSVHFSSDERKKIEKNRKKNHFC